MSTINEGRVVERRPVRWTAVVLTAGILCIGLSGCVMDTAAPVSKVSQGDSDSPHLRYFGGPKSPMWADR